MVIASDSNREVDVHGRGFVRAGRQNFLARRETSSEKAVSVLFCGEQNLVAGTGDDRLSELSVDDLARGCCLRLVRPCPPFVRLVRPCLPFVCVF